MIKKDANEVIKAVKKIAQEHKEKIKELEKQLTEY